MLPPGLSMRSTTAEIVIVLRARRAAYRERVAADQCPASCSPSRISPEATMTPIASSPYSPHCRLRARDTAGSPASPPHGIAGFLVLADDAGDDLLEFRVRLQAVDEAARERVLRDVPAGRTHAGGRLVGVGLDQSRFQLAGLRRRPP